MARPKKIEDSIAVSLVDGLCSQTGDPKQLRFTALEAYAASVGVDVKAYDLRRNQVVIRRIAEIEALELNPNALEAFAYKDLDVKGFIKTNAIPAKLTQALSELDERWRKLYDYTITLFEQARDSADKLRITENRMETIEIERANITEKLRVTTASAESLKAENAYLRKALREYLYPTLADEILQTPGADRTKISATATDAMADADAPESFSVAVATDQQLQSREDNLLERLRKLAQE